MIGPMDRPRLVLASASPRRFTLLTALGATFTVITTDAETVAMPTPPAIATALPAVAVSPDAHPTLLAWRKASTVAALAPDAVILGADTIVVIAGAVLNKPTNAAHAHAMLRRLAGRTHTVYTGLCVVVPPSSATNPGATLLEVAAADVTFHALTDAAIAAYVATGEPLDKAGAYGFQGLGRRMVQAVSGSPATVVGLPLALTHRLLSSAGVFGLVEPTVAYARWLHNQEKEPQSWPSTLP